MPSKRLLDVNHPFAASAKVPFIYTCTLSFQQPSSFAQARRIIKTDGFGLKGLNKGLTSTLGRHGVFNMIYFGFYFNVKDAIPTSPVIKPSASPPSLQGAVSGRGELLTSAFCRLEVRRYTCPSHLASWESCECLTA